MGPAPGTTLDIGPGEFGVTLAVPVLAESSDPPIAVDTVRDELAASIRQLSRGPRRTTSIGRLDVPAARIDVDRPGGRVQVIFARPSGTTAGFVEEVVAVLQAEAARDRLSVGEGLAVTLVAVAVPQ